MRVLVFDSEERFRGLESAICEENIAGADDLEKRLQGGAEPVVVLLHGGIEHLRGLSRLWSEGRWPKTLLACIVFSTSAYAGLRSRRVAANTLQELRVPPELVYLVADAVGPPLASSSLSRRVTNFVRQLRKNADGPAPFSFLEPERWQNGVVTGYVALRLSTRSQEWRDCLRSCVDWQEVEESFSSLTLDHNFPMAPGVGLGSDGLLRWIAAEERVLRSYPLWRCPACETIHLIHLRLAALLQALGSGDGPVSLGDAGEVAAQLVGVLTESRSQDWWERTVRCALAFRWDSIPPKMLSEIVTEVQVLARQNCVLDGIRRERLSISLTGITGYLRDNLSPTSAHFTRRLRATASALACPKYHAG